MNKQLLLFGFILFNVGVISAQCLSGDCKNGSGKFNFGYAVYSGKFLNSLPNGTGTMDYGDGEKYAGEFTAGSENGKGILHHKDGKTEEVTYNMGKIVRKVIPNYAGQAKIEGCNKGNCREGYGEFEFPSGNRYFGNFENGRIHGQGKMNFASGNILEGQFVENVIKNGKLIYHPEKISFTGTFNEDGTPKTGEYEFPSNGSTVTIRNNEMIAVHNPLVEAQQKAAEAKKKVEYVKCPVCNGEVITSSKSSYSYTTAGTYQESAFGQGRINLTNPTTTTSTGRTFYDVCGRCKGAKKVER